MFAGKKYVGCWRGHEARGDNTVIRNIQDWLSLNFDE